MRFITRLLCTAYAFISFGVADVSNGPAYSEATREFPRAIGEIQKADHTPPGTFRLQLEYTNDYFHLNEKIFLANVSIGNPSQNIRLPVTFDLTTWVPNTDTPSSCQRETGWESETQKNLICDRNELRATWLYNETNSKSLHKSKLQFNIPQNNNTEANSTGYYANDDFQLAGLGIPNVTFAVLSNYSETPRLGLCVSLVDECNDSRFVNGGRYRADIDSDRKPTFTEVLKRDGLVDWMVISMYLGGRGANNEEILFGGVDKSKFEGNLFEIADPNLLYGIRLSKYGGPKYDIYLPSEVGFYSTIKWDQPRILLPPPMIPIIMDTAEAYINESYDKDSLLINCDPLNDLALSIILEQSLQFEVTITFEHLVVPAPPDNNGDVPSTSAGPVCKLMIGQSQDPRHIDLGEPFFRAAYVVMQFPRPEDLLINYFVAPAVVNATPAGGVAPDIVVIGEGGVENSTDLLLNIFTTGAASVPTTASEIARETGETSTHTRSTSHSASSSPSLSAAAVAYNQSTWIQFRCAALIWVLYFILSGY